MEPILNIAAPVLIILGASLTASNLGARITGIGFIAFTLGSLAWLGVGLLIGPSSLVWQNVVLAVLNGFGIWRWLGRQQSIEEGAERAAERSEQRPGDALFPASRLAGGDLLGPSGEPLGKLVDAMIGAGSGRLRYLVVAEGGVGGVGETLRRLDWSEVRADGETIACGLDERSLSAAPAIDRSDWPAR